MPILIAIRNLYTTCPSSTPAKLCDLLQGVLYWMWRDKRVQDNWALLYSQKVALQLNVPLQVRLITLQPGGCHAAASLLQGRYWALVLHWIASPPCHKNPHLDCLADVYIFVREYYSGLCYWAFVYFTKSF